MLPLEYLEGTIKCINPTAEIESFTGIAELSLNKLVLKEHLTKKNMMLRGCKIKNTEWVIGLTIYTGKSTAIMMNAGKPFIKTSNIEQRVNYFILALLGVELLCNSASAIYCYFKCEAIYRF